MNTIKNVAKKIKPYIHETPILTSNLLNEIVGCNIFYKCENFQKMGAFKMRGAMNAILNLSEEQKDKGVVTHSSGNFAQALSLAANKLGITAYIVMPSSTPKVKIDAVKGYGGEVTICLPTLKDRKTNAERISIENGATFIHPSNDLDVIKGQGTAAFELLEKYSNLDAIFTPVGGGGLVAGTILAVQQKSPNCKIYGGEPENVDDAFRSLKSGRIETNETTDTIADGLKTHLGDINFPIIRNGIEEIVLVTEDQILSALKLIWSRLKIVIEPSSAVAFAALINKSSDLNSKNIGVILSGGNVNLDNITF